VGLRRAEIERRARVTRAATRERRERAEAQTARLRAREATAPAQSGGAGAAALGQAPRSDLGTGSRRAGAQVCRPGEWAPRPVPRPTSALRGEVEALATRHAADRQSVLATSVPLESDRVEEIEAVEEEFAPAQDLQLDEILARRRA